MKIDQLLSALRKVKKTGPDQWVACCPAHEDKSPSMTIKATPETILLHCFGGCAPSEILGAIGMTFDDLYPPRNAHVKPQKLSPRSALECIAFEALVVAASGATMRQRDLTPDEMARLVQATGRIQASLDMAGIAA